MLNGEFVWKWMGNKGFVFCKKWFIIIFHIFNSVSRRIEAKRIESIESISRSISFCFLFYDIESEKNIIRAATIQFYGWRFVFCAMISKKLNRTEIFNIKKGLHKTSHSWEEEKILKIAAIFYLTFSNPCSTSVSNQKVCRFNAVTMKLS